MAITAPARWRLRPVSGASPWDRRCTGNIGPLLAGSTLKPWSISAGDGSVLSLPIFAREMQGCRGSEQQPGLATIPHCQRHVYIYIYMYVCMYVCMCMCIYIYIYIYIYTYVYTYILHIYVCILIIYIYIYICIYYCRVVRLRSKVWHGSHSTTDWHRRSLQQNIDRRSSRK